MAHLLDILQDAETVLNLKPEELGELLLVYLEDSQEIYPKSLISYRGLFERLDNSYRLSEEQRREMRRRYPRDRDEAVLCGVAVVDSGKACCATSRDGA